MQVTTLLNPALLNNVPTSITALTGVIPASTAWIISALTFCNKVGVAVTVTVTIFNGTTDTNIAFNAPIAVGDTLVLGGENLKIIIGTGYSIRCLCSASNSVDASASVAQFA